MTEAQHMEYEAQGYLVLEGILESATLSRLRGAFDRAAGHGALEDLPNQDDCFIHLAEHQGLFPVLHRIVGDDIQVRSLRGLRIAPDSGGRGWRREVAGMLGVSHPLSTLAVQAFLALDDTPEGGACLAVVPGSHRFKSDLSFPAITFIEEMPHHVAPTVRAGAAVVMNANLWQARTRNASSTPQRFLEYTYVHTWMRQVLPPLSPSAVAAASSSHNLRHLFGLPSPEPRGEGYWGRKVEGYPPSSGLPERRFSPLKVVGRGGPNR